MFHTANALRLGVTQDRLSLLPAWTDAPLYSERERAALRWTSAQATFDEFGEAARNAGIVMIPAMGFFGGFADLLLTAALDDWEEVDAIEIMVGLDSWHPTQGTRLTGKRNTAQRLAVMRLLAGRFSDAGAQAPGAILDAKDVLESLAPEYLSLDIAGSRTPIARSEVRNAPIS